jgi:integrase
MDAGIPLATIQRWLGHANISQTSPHSRKNSSRTAAPALRYGD